MLELLERGTVLHAPFEADIELTRRHGDFVFVMGRELVIDAPGSPAYSRRFTNVWSADGESWRLLARHANRIVAP